MASLISDCKFFHQAALFWVIGKTFKKNLLDMSYKIYVYYVEWRNVDLLLRGGEVCQLLLSLILVVLLIVS